MKHYSIIIVPTILSILLANKYGSAEARVRAWGVATKGNKQMPQRTQLEGLDLQYNDPIRHVISSRKGTFTFHNDERPATKKTASIITTEITELADCFQHALMIAAKNRNNNKHEIHVGKLLSASERLESTMRRIGLNQSANDIAGNVGKIRNVYSKLPPSSRDSMSALLQHEINTCGMDKKKKIPDNSAASGFLWLGRSLNCQYDMFSHLLEHEDAEPYEAASIAYERDLRPHLPWPIKKVCQAAMSATLKNTRRKQMFARIGGFSEDSYGEREDKATKEDLKHMVDSLQPMMSRWRQVFSELEIGF